MNLNPNITFVDGLNTFPILDYIDEKIATGGGGTVGGAGGDLSTYLYTSNVNNYTQLYINNSNLYGEIRFRNINTAPNARDHNAKIDIFGKLAVYHPYNALNPLYTEGWKDIESELDGLQLNATIANGEMALVQGQIAQIESSLTIVDQNLGLIGIDVAYHTTQLGAIESQLSALNFGQFNPAEYEQYIQQNLGQLTIDFANKLFDFKSILQQSRFDNFISGIIIPAGVGAVIGGIAYSMDMGNLHNTYSNVLEQNPNLTPSQRRQILEPASNAIQQEYINMNSNYSNMTYQQGFINSNILTSQTVPYLRTNKIEIGNITTPNSAYQLEMTGDLNTNMLYINSTSLTSLLNEKQNNLTAVAPIYITTGNIGLNYDSSLTKVGNNLSVVKTATAPLSWTGNDIALSYDSTLLNNSGSLGVSIGAESKWSFTGGNIYNKSLTNVGIGTLSSITSKLTIHGDIYTASNINCGIRPLTFISSFTNSTLTPVTGSDEFYLQYTTNGTLVLNEPSACDLLIVGAGGDGGIGASSGGAGAGEVIYYPNFPLRSGTLNINIGTQSSTPSNRISSITHTSGTLINAKGGGNGGTSVFYSTSGGTVSALTAISGTSDAYISITAGTTLTLNANCSADIFMIGGGGSGGNSFNSGGGGAGSCIIAINQTLNAGTYNITVGNGGAVASGNNPGLNGQDSSIGSLFIAKGGGGGGYGNGNNGGCGGGAGYGNYVGTVSYTGGSSLTTNVVNGNTNIGPSITSTYAVLGKAGGDVPDWSFSGYYEPVNAAGGGGIGIAGANATTSACGIGGDGIYQITIGGITYNLKNHFSPSSSFGVNDGSGNFYIGGGGGGGGYQASNPALIISGGKGGGGAGKDGNYPGQTSSTGDSGVANTGSGGGGSIADQVTLGGAGGSGLVIIRFKNYLSIIPPTSGGSGGGGAKSQIGAVAGVKYDDYKSLALAGLNGTSTNGGNGGSGNTNYNTRYTSTITGSSLSVGLGGSGVTATPATPTVKSNYGDGGDGNGGVGYQGIVIIRFKNQSTNLHVKAIKDNANTGIIINANESPTSYQLRVYPWSDTYQLTGIATRGWSFRCHDGNNNLDLLNLFSSFGGRIGVKTKNPTATLDVNGDIACKTFSVVGNEFYGITCQIVNQHNTGEANLTISAGASGNYGSCGLSYLPIENQGLISCTKSLKIKTGNDADNSFIYIDNTNGRVGIGNNVPQAKLDVNGTILASAISVLTVNSDAVATGNISCTSMDLNNGSIINVNKLASVEIETGPIKCGAINLQGSGITNGATIQGTCTQARFLVANVNEWHYSQDNRNRFYFTDDTTTPTESHTVFRTGSNTHYFQNRDGVDYCLLDRFGISTYFEVISGGGYDAVSVLDASVTGVYVYRRMLVKLNSFSEVHRCFCEDELYIDYDQFINEFIGRIVVSKGKIKTALKEVDKDWEILEGKDGITIDDSHAVVELSRKKKDKAVVGIITKRNQNNDLPGRLVINSLGETGIWVVNTGGDIETGDLITTSDELGYGEKQDCDFIKNYTIGKCMIDCSFELDSPNYKCEDLGNDIRRAFLPIFIYSG